MCANTPIVGTTPIQRNYLRLKQQTDADTLLLMRLGDFYEIFYDDALRAAPLLGIALTRRAGAPLCGIPVHCIDTYLARIIRAGLKAALADDLHHFKGEPRRYEIVRVYMPDADGDPDDPRIMLPWHYNRRR